MESPPPIKCECNPDEFVPRYGISEKQKGEEHVPKGETFEGGSNSMLRGNAGTLSRQMPILDSSITFLPPLFIFYAALCRVGCTTLHDVHESTEGHSLLYHTSGAALEQCDDATI